MRPLFTVILVTYRRFDYFVQALNSILGQTFRDFECLIFNDFPDDNERIADYVSTLNDQRLVFHPSHQSVGANFWRNKGINLSSGEIISFLDDDDIWLPNKLELHADAHRTKNIDFVYSAYYMTWPDLNKEDTLRGDSYDMDKMSLKDAIAQGLFSISTTSCVTVRKEIGVYFDTNLSSYQDWDAWFQIVLNNEKMTIWFLNTPLIHFIQHQGYRTSKSLEKRYKALSQIRQKYLDLGVNINGFIEKQEMNVLFLRAKNKKSKLSAMVFLLRNTFRRPSLLLDKYFVRRVGRLLFKNY